MKYDITDFEILRGNDTEDSRIAYVFKSKDNKITANFFFIPKNVQTRGLIWKEGKIVECFHIVYPFANHDSISELPNAERVLKTIIKRLEEPHYKNFLS